VTLTDTDGLRGLQASQKERRRQLRSDANGYTPRMISKLFKFFALKKLFEAIRGRRRAPPR